MEEMVGGEVEGEEDINLFKWIINNLRMKIENIVGKRMDELNEKEKELIFRKYYLAMNDPFDSSAIILGCYVNLSEVTKDLYKKYWIIPPLKKSVFSAVA